MTMLMHHMLRAAAGYAAPTPPSTDPQFNYVTMLLHGDGTNGAQNNTFVDSSTNNFTITRNGTPTQGSFSPYGDLWSNNFPANTSNLSVASNAAFAFPGQFTVEAWFCWTTTPSAGQITGVLASGGFNITYNTTLQFNLFGTGAIASAAFTPVIGRWYHIAMTRNASNLCTVWIDGVSSATGTSSASFVQGAWSLYGGSNNGGAGYVSNLRIVKGTALYTSNFTPSTTPLTAVSGTSLLTCQSNRFRDASSNNFAITVTGTPSVQRFSPFDPAAEYSTSVIGGSGYFKGSPDYLSSSTGTALNFGTGDFTVEFWSYWSTHAAYAGMVSTSGGIIGQFQVIFNASANSLRLDIGGTQWTPSPTLTANAWTHIAVVRSGTTVTLYFNGVSVATTTNGNSVNASNLRVGADKDTSNYYAGYISNLRTVTGTAVYTANFTPPTAPLTAITNTSMLLNTVNAGIFDNAMMNDLVTVGNAQISTSVKKYGTGSMAFDLIDDCLVAPSSTNFQYGAGDFTVEFWLYFASLPSLTAIIFDQRTAATQVVPTLYYDTNNLYYLTNGAVRISGAFTTAGAWVHVALCRSAGSTRLFVNGVQLGSTYTDANNYVASPVYVGARWDLQGELNGYIDDLRITKGYARYTANFTPPTAAFPNN